MKGILIFCQAPFDVIHILKMYDEYKSKSDISIAVIKNKNIYNYLLSLKLKIKNIWFVEVDKNFSFYNPLHLIKIKQNLNSSYDKIFLIKKFKKFTFLLMFMITLPLV